MTPLLTTKLQIPRHSQKMVARPRLLDQVDKAARRRLTLVSAPAGFGKSTVLGQWLAARSVSAGWLALDERDNQTAHFLSYVIGALQTAVPDLGRAALTQLHTAPAPPLEEVLTYLLNEMAELTEDLVLVIDDYHVIESTEIDGALGFLIDYLPERMHLVIATREDPQFPLARLRARGQLGELRARDLRFTPDEAATFLNWAMELGLSGEDVAALEARTDGWIAGLQMAALSIRGREDAAEFVMTLTGSNRYIADYLVEEVLRRQPDSIRRFLLSTSILERLSTELCAAVTELEESAVPLETLQRNNLFVVALDDRGKWFRYHHLFRDALRAQLLRECPEQLTALHLRASRWYAAQGQLKEAVEHATAAEDWELVAALVEAAWPTIDGTDQWAAWLGWVRPLPAELLRSRQVLSVAYAWALLNTGKLEAAEVQLKSAEAVVSSTHTGRSEDAALLRSLPSSIAIAHAYLAIALGKVERAEGHARRALELLPENDHHKRGQVLTLIGLSQWSTGNIEAARSCFSEFMHMMRVAEDLASATSAVFVLADLNVELGRLHEAMQVYRDGLRRAERRETRLLGTEDIYRGMAELHLQWGALETAGELLQKGERLGERGSMPDWERRLLVAQARLRVSEGEPEAALELLEEAQDLFIRTPLPIPRPLDALRAEIWVRQGQLEPAQAWAAGKGLTAETKMAYLTQFDHLVYAKLLISRVREQRDGTTLEQAETLLTGIRQAAEAGGRTGRLIEALVSTALLHEAAGESDAALEAVERALSLGEPEGYHMVFALEGEPMERLLRAAQGRCTHTEYIGKLLAANPGTRGSTSEVQRLLEPLSERELEVLRYLGSDLSGPEIARELFVSLNTLRTHTKNIYSKLGVNGRRIAVRRAGELALL